MGPVKRYKKLRETLPKDEMLKIEDLKTGRLL